MKEYYFLTYSDNDLEIMADSLENAKAAAMYFSHMLVACPPCLTRVVEL